MELYESPKQVNGINLADYYPNQRSYNSVVYVHKKCFEKSKKDKKEEKVKKEKKTKKKTKCDKCEQCTDLDYNPSLAQSIELNNTLLAQRLQYAKTLVPLVIPPSGIVSPVYYTIKASKKKDNNKKPKEETSAQTVTLKKGKSKKVVETYRHHAGKESLSVKETVTSYSHSSNNDTLNELQLINPSLCCSFSEISEHKQVKKDKRDKPKPEPQKLVPSESFEALATEFLNTSGDTKIKIHLMNETEKSLLTENIRVPVLNAIRDCIAEINNQKSARDKEVITVQKYVKCHTEKLDNIMEKLSCIEQKFDQYVGKERNKDNIGNIRNEFRKQVANTRLLKPRSPKAQVSKASTLEQLGEDILEQSEKNPIPGLELRDESSGDDCFPRPTLSARKRAKAQSAVIHLENIEHSDLRHVSGDGEEDLPSNSNSRSALGQLIRPDRANRIPARFCWTDAAKKPT